MSTWDHLGSQGSKGRFHQKCYNLSMLHKMTIRLIHVHQLEYNFYKIFLFLKIRQLANSFVLLHFRILKFYLSNFELDHRDHRFDFFLK